MFFVAAEKDRFEPAFARRFVELAGPSGSVWVVPGANHCGGLLTAWDEYSARMVEFFNVLIK